MALCKKILTGIPMAEAPVNNKNFLSIPPTFSFTVRNINATPNKKKAAPEMIIKRKRKLPSNSLNGGIAIAPGITMNNPTNAQNIDQINFPFTFSHFLF